METKLILEKVNKLLSLYKQGKLGGDFMPEDNNPHLSKSSETNFIYFTLPMALNYQRNSYKLWESTLAAFNDIETRDIFNPKCVISMTIEQLTDKLLKHKVALQKNKHPMIWKTICNTLCEKFDGKISNFLKSCNYDIKQIKTYITSNKKQFPYLCGPKILNYWLYVLTNYTSAKFTNRDEISVAPDTHILKCSVKLGVINTSDLERADIREFTSARWKELLKDSSISPIDIHTPLWLWSRSNFQIEF